jgi:hypothetical protein
MNSWVELILGVVSSSFPMWSVDKASRKVEGEKVEEGGGLAASV